MGEAYWEDFNVWWDEQSADVRMAMRTKYPEPEGWLGFWRSYGVKV